MQTLKFSRLATLMLAAVLALMVAACSPSATPTTAPSSGDTSATTAPGGTDDPTAAVKDFYAALFGGGDAASYVCTAAGVDSKTLQDSYKQVAAAFASAKIDTTGLTFTASNVTADKANVAVSGSMSVDTSGVKTDVPLNVPSIPVVKENGSWKICG